MTNCAECDGVIEIPSNALAGEIVTCSDCGASFEIAKSSDGGVELKSAQTVGEDWGQ